MNSNWSYSPETVKLGCDLCDLDLWPLTLTFCMDVTFVTGNNAWKFHDDSMMGTGQKGVTDRRTDRWTDRRTDRQTDWTIHRAAWSQLKIKHLSNTKYSWVPLYKVVQYNMTLHTNLQRRKQNINKSESKLTMTPPHTLPRQASYGVSIVRKLTTL